MSDYTTRYYQLTSDILLEYNYAAENGGESNIEANELGKVSIIDNPSINTQFHLINKNYGNINLSESNFVVPSNKSQTSFVKLQHVSGLNTIFSSPDTTVISVKDFEYKTPNDSYTLSFDRLRFHFTSKNYMGDYDGLIFQAYVYDTQKNKKCFMSFLLSKTDNISLNENVMLINQRLYTTYIDVKIPSIYKILKSYEGKYNNNDIVYDELKKQLNISDNNLNPIRLMVNTPININLFGVKHEINKNGFSYYLTENVKNISIPSKDSYENLYVDIFEANDGDYFNIQIKMSDGTSFSDFIYNMDEHPETYVILHELKLTEHYVNTFTNTINSEVTHTQQYVINSVSSYTDEHEQVHTIMNEKALDEPMTFRPICKYGSRCFKFTIEDTLKILNTKDNTTIVKTGTYTYNYPSRYGKKMQQINLTEVPSIINVYNKRTDSDIDTDTTAIRITNGGGTNTKIETQTHNIVSFIESTNIVVSVQQIPASLVESI